MNLMDMRGILVCGKGWFVLFAVSVLGCAGQCVLFCMYAARLGEPFSK